MFVLEIVNFILEDEKEDAVEEEVSYPTHDIAENSVFFGLNAQIVCRLLQHQKHCYAPIKHFKSLYARDGFR